MDFKIGDFELKVEGVELKLIEVGDVKEKIVVFVEEYKEEFKKFVECFNLLVDVFVSEK